MRSARNSRTATAEVHWGRDPKSILWIGNSVVYQYWPVLSPYFRDILLAPQRRTEDEIVAWTWREETEQRTPTGAEFAALRKRLKSDQHALAENARDRATAGRQTAERKNPANIAQLASAMDGLVARLLAMPDAELATFIACTESGLRLHSWGGAPAAVPFFPESRKRETGPGTEDFGGAAPGPKTGSPPSRRRRMAMAWFAALALGGAGWSGWQWRTAADRTGARTAPGDNATERAAKYFTPGLPATRLGETAARAPERSPVYARAESDPTAGIDPRGSGTTAEFARTRADPDEPAAKVMRRSQETGAPTPVVSQAGLSTGAAGPAGATPAGWSGSMGSAAGPMNPTAGAAGSPAAATGSPAGPNAAAMPQAGTSTSGAMATAEIGITPPPAPAAKPPPPPPHDAPSDRAPAPAANRVAADRKNPATEARETKTEKTDAEEARARPTTSDRNATTKPTVAARGADAALARADAWAEEAQRRARAADNRQQPAAPAHDDLAAPDPSGATSIRLDEAATNAAAPAPARWEQAERLSAAGWNLRMLTDAILPTVPMRADAERNLEAVRAQVLAKQRAHLPQAFATVRGRRGYAVETAGGRLQWHLPAGTESIATGTSAGRAELSWSEGQIPTPGVYELADEHGRQLARLEIEASGATVIHLARGARGWFWYAVEGAEARLVWRRMPDATIPARWRHSSDGRGSRLEVALGASNGAATFDTIALYDEATGWGLVCGMARTPVTLP